MAIGDTIIILFFGHTFAYDPIAVSQEVDRKTFNPNSLVKRINIVIEILLALHLSIL